MAAEIEDNGRKAGKGPPGFRLILWVGLAITIVLPGLALRLPTVLGYFNGKLFDEFLMRTSSGPVSERILIVDIDENSLHTHGQWPWPRYKIAAMLNSLTEAGAAAIALDMMFPERDRTSLSIIQADLRRDLDLSISLEAIDGLCPDNDLLLADAISKSPVVLGYQFLFDSATASRGCRLHPLVLTGTRNGREDIPFLWRPNSVTCNLNDFSAKTDRSGFFNVSPDADGILRRVPLFMAYEDQFYPSLALAAVMKALKLEQTGSLRHGDDLLYVGGAAVPFDSSGSLLVNYKGPGRTYAYVSAADLLAGRIAVERIKDKIVFVSTSAAGLKEFRSTPTDALFPGVEVHATVADNLLNRNFLSRPDYAPGLELLLCLVCGFLYVFATIRAGALRSLLLVTFAGAGLGLLSFHLFTTRGVYISPVLPLLVLTGDFALLNLLKFWREELKSRQQTRDLALAQAAIIESLAALTETRDPDTGGHIKRTQEYVRLLARALRRMPAYRTALSDEMIDLLYKSAPLHDIGKVGVPDRILLKPGRLSYEEFEEMKKHATIGKDVIGAIQRRLGNRSFLKIAYEITHSHHEKWDGSGYPQGLKGEQIPLSGRLMAIADMYDALTSDRVYKEVLSHEEAVRVMTPLSAINFDPQMFRIFLEVQEDFQSVARKLADPSNRLPA